MRNMAKKVINELYANRDEPDARIINELIKNLSAGNYPTALSNANSLRLTFPYSIQILNIQAACYDGMGKVDQSLKIYAEALKLNPAHAPTYCNLGNVLAKAGNLDEAICNYEFAIKYDPSHAIANNNLGTIYRRKKDHKRSVGFFKKALKLDPKYPVAHLNLGMSLRDLGQVAEGISEVKKALKLKSNYVDAYIALGIMLNQTSKAEESEAAFKSALKHQPESVPARQYLCDLLDRKGNYHELLEFAENCNQTGIYKSDSIVFFEALARFHLKDHTKCLCLIRSINENQLPDSLQTRYLELSAKCLHNLKQYDDAFKKYELMNKKAKQLAKIQSNLSNSYAKKISTRKKQLTQLVGRPCTLNSNPKEQNPCVFLVGFPRSGTTLLDTILSAHSDIFVAEERPMIDAAIDLVGENISVSEIENLTTPEVERAKKAYENELKNYAEKHKSLVIDKLPLNLNEAPLINKLYPDAKFILALRHPLDSILSSYMQNFDLNPAMENMLSLKSASKLYSDSMAVFNLCRERYNLNCHELRYENLVEDMQREIKSLLSFLELDWQDSILDYHNKKNRGRLVLTPSYSQVVKPIYKTSRMKWKNYQKHLDSCMGHAHEWIAKYDYL